MWCCLNGNKYPPNYLHFVWGFFRTMEVAGKSDTRVSQVDKRPICQLCIEGGNAITAETYCSVCDEHLCATCSDSHRRSKASRNHKLLDSGTVRPNTPDECLDNSSEYCGEHPKELVKYFCQHHNSLHCEDCVVFNKSKNDNCDIRKITDIAKGYKSSKDFEQLQAATFTLIQDASERKDIIKQMSTTIKHYAERSKEAVGESTENLIKVLIRGAKEMTADISSTSHNLQTRLTSFQQQCDGTDSEAQQIANDFKKNENNDVMLFISSHKARHKMNVLSQRLQDVAEESNQIPLSKFEVNTTMQDILKSNPIGVYRETDLSVYACMQRDQSATSKGKLLPSVLFIYFATSL